MNPFKPKNISNIRISSTNIKGMKIGTDREIHKLHTLIDHNADICICIDHHMDAKKLATLTKNNRQIISKYKIYGTPTLKRGILVLVKKTSGCILNNITTHSNNDILTFDTITPDLNVIKTTAVYAPSEDLPSFWDKVNEINNSGTHDYKLIIGDCNVTLNHELDSYGYKGDPHPKSRNVINGWLHNETIIDTFRYFHNDTESYTYRIKNCKKKSRLDYCLTSPSLIPHIKNISHKANNYINTDHATIVLDLDFTCSTRGKGTFRSPPNIHKDPIYCRLIKNTIKRTIYSCITQSKETDLEISLLESRIKLEEELHSIETKIPTWKTDTRKDTLKHTIAILLSNEPTNEALINRSLTITKPTLLEYILKHMADETITYSKLKNKNNHQETTELKETLQDLLAEPESDKNTIMIHETEAKLENHETKLLYDTLSKKKTLIC